MLAAEYGVPQLRERVILVATRKPNGFVFPSLRMLPRRDAVGCSLCCHTFTVGDVINDLEEPLQKQTQVPFQTTAIMMSHQKGIGSEFMEFLKVKTCLHSYNYP